MKVEPLSVTCNVMFRFRPWWWRFTPHGRRDRHTAITLIRHPRRECPAGSPSGGES